MEKKEKVEDQEPSGMTGLSEKNDEDLNSSKIEESAFNLLLNQGAGGFQWSQSLSEKFTSFLETYQDELMKNNVPDSCSYDWNNFLKMNQNVSVLPSKEESDEKLNVTPLEKSNEILQFPSNEILPDYSTLISDKDYEFLNDSLFMENSISDSVSQGSTEICTDLTKNIEEDMQCSQKDSSSNEHIDASLKESIFPEPINFNLIIAIDREGNVSCESDLSDHKRQIEQPAEVEKVHTKDEETVSDHHGSSITPSMNIEEKAVFNESEIFDNETQDVKSSVTEKSSAEDSITVRNENEDVPATSPLISQVVSSEDRSLKQDALKFPVKNSDERTLDYYSSAPNEPKLEFVFEEESDIENSSHTQENNAHKEHSSVDKALVSSCQTVDLAFYNTWILSSKVQLLKEILAADYITDYKGFRTIIFVMDHRVFPKMSNRIQEYHFLMNWFDDEDLFKQEKIIIDFQSGARPILILKHAHRREVDITKAHHIINFDVPRYWKIEDFKELITTLGRGTNKKKVTFILSDEYNSKIIRQVPTLLSQAGLDSNNRIFDYDPPKPNQAEVNNDEPKKAQKVPKDVTKRLKNKSDRNAVAPKTRKPTSSNSSDKSQSTVEDEFDPRLESVQGRANLSQRRNPEIAEVMIKRINQALFGQAKISKPSGVNSRSLHDPIKEQDSPVNLHRRDVPSARGPSGRIINIVQSDTLSDYDGLLKLYDKELEEKQVASVALCQEPSSVTPLKMINDFMVPDKSSPLKTDDPPSQKELEEHEKAVPSVALCQEPSSVTPLKMINDFMVPDKLSPPKIDGSPSQKEIKEHEEQVPSVALCQEPLSVTPVKNSNDFMVPDKLASSKTDDTPSQQELQEREKPIVSLALCQEPSTVTPLQNSNDFLVPDESSPLKTDDTPSQQELEEREKQVVSVALCQEPSTVTPLQNSNDFLVPDKSSPLKTDDTPSQQELEVRENQVVSVALCQEPSSATPLKNINDFMVPDNSSPSKTDDTPSQIKLEEREKHVASVALCQGLSSMTPLKSLNDFMVPDNSPPSKTDDLPSQQELEEREKAVPSVVLCQEPTLLKNINDFMLPDKLSRSKTDDTPSQQELEEREKPVVSVALCQGLSSMTPLQNSNDSLVPDKSSPSKTDDSPSQKEIEEHEEQVPSVALCQEPSSMPLQNTNDFMVPDKLSPSKTNDTPIQKELEEKQVASGALCQEPSSMTRLKNISDFMVPDKLSPPKTDDLPSQKEIEKHEEQVPSVALCQEPLSITPVKNANDFMVPDKLSLSKTDDPPIQKELEENDNHGQEPTSVTPSIQNDCLRPEESSSFNDTPKTPIVIPLVQNNETEFADRADDTDSIQENTAKIEDQHSIPVSEVEAEAQIRDTVLSYLAACQIPLKSNVDVTIGSKNGIVDFSEMYSPTLPIKNEDSISENSNDPKLSNATDCEVKSDDLPVRVSNSDSWVNTNMLQKEDEKGVDAAEMETSSIQIIKNSSSLNEVAFVIKEDTTRSSPAAIEIKFKNCGDDVKVALKNGTLIVDLSKMLNSFAQHVKTDESTNTVAPEHPEVNSATTDTSVSKIDGLSFDECVKSCMITPQLDENMIQNENVTVHEEDAFQIDIPKETKATSLADLVRRHYWAKFYSETDHSISERDNQDEAVEVGEKQNTPSMDS